MLKTVQKSNYMEELDVDEAQHTISTLGNMPENII